MSDKPLLLPDLTGIVDDIAALKGLPVDAPSIVEAREAMRGLEEYYGAVDALPLTHTDDPLGFAQWLRDQEQRR